MDLPLYNDFKHVLFMDVLSALAIDKTTKQFVEDKLQED
jgi:hypothetical protein